MKSAALSLDALQAAVDQLPDSALMSSRRAALEHLRKHGLPTTRDEDWKYTDLSAVVDISNRSFGNTDSTSPSADAQALIATIHDAIAAEWLVIFNGRLDSQSLARFDQDGIRVSRLSDSAEEISFDAPLSDLNLALLQDGIRLHITKDTVAEQPIGILILDEAAEAPAISQSRVEIELEPGSKATIIEFQASIGSADQYGNSVNSLLIGDNAHADYIRIQDRSLAHMHTNRLSVQCERDSQFNYSGFDLPDWRWPAHRQPHTR
jgi:Fe-S cluster assembly protein SufD